MSRDLNDCIQLPDDLGCSMKIGHMLSTSDYGGCETLCLNFVKWQPGRVIIFSKKHIRNQNFFSLKNLFHVETSLKITNLVRICIYRHKLKSLFADLTGLIIWNGRMNLFTSWLVCSSNPNLKIIAHIGTAVKTTKKSEFILYFLYKRSLSKKIILVAASKPVLDSLQDNSLFSNFQKILISNGINTSLQVNTTSTEIRLGYFGRISKDKNLDLVIETLASEFINLPLTFRIIGDGEDLLRLKKITEDLRLSNQVIFNPAITNPCENFSANDIFIFAPSSEEGFGLALYEAISAGMMAVGRNLEIVRDAIGEDLYTFELNPQSLASAIRNILISPVDAQKHFKRRKVFIKNHYNESSTFQRYLSLL